MAGKLISIVAALLFHPFHIAQSIESHLLEHRQVWHQRHIDYFSLVDGCYTFVQFAERLHAKIVLETILVECHILQVAFLVYVQNLTTVSIYRTAYVAELVVRQFKHPSQNAEGTYMLLWNIRPTLVAYVMFYHRPHMLKSRTQLYLERILVHLRMFIIKIQLLGQSCYIVQRLVAESVQLTNLAFVNAVSPVDVKEMLYDRGYLIHIVREECDDTQSQDIGNIIDTFIFITFTSQFADKTALFLYAALHSGNINTIFFNAVCYLLFYNSLQSLQMRLSFTVLVEQLQAVGFQFGILLFLCHITFIIKQ